MHPANHYYYYHYYHYYYHLRYLRYIYICINKHGNQSSISAHPPSVLMHGDLPNKLRKKMHAEQCLALYSRWWTQQTHACFLLFSCTEFWAHKQDTRQYPSCFVVMNITYRVSYRDNCIVSYRGKNVSLQTTWSESACPANQHPKNTTKKRKSTYLCAPRDF